MQNFKQLTIMCSSKTATARLGMQFMVKMNLFDLLIFSFSLHSPNGIGKYCIELSVHVWQARFIRIQINKL